MNRNPDDTMQLDPDDLRRVRAWLDQVRLDPRRDVDEPATEALADWVERGQTAADADRVERALAADPDLLAALLVLAIAKPQLPFPDELHRATDLVTNRPVRAAPRWRRADRRTTPHWKQALAAASVVLAAGVGLVLGDGLAAMHWQQEQRALAEALFGTPSHLASGDLP